jgi:hypothetical protein
VNGWNRVDITVLAQDAYANDDPLELLLRYSASDWVRFYSSEYGSYTPYIEVYYDSIVAPTVTTQDVTNIETTSATGNGNVTNTGGENCTMRGIWWGTSSGVYNHSVNQTGDFGTGAFTALLTDLPPGTTIYCKAFAVGAAGTGSGDEVSFLTKPAAPTGLSATDGGSTSQVTLTWTDPTGADTINIYRDGGLVDTVEDGVQTYADTGADAGTVTAGTTTASDGTSSNYTTISNSGHSSHAGTVHVYTLIASNASGDSEETIGENGNRGVGAVTLQAQRRVHNTGEYANLVGATTTPYNDTTAIAGVVYDYRYAVSATGAVTVYSTPNAGHVSDGSEESIPTTILRAMLPLALAIGLIVVVIGLRSGNTIIILTGVMIGIVGYIAITIVLSIL